MNQSSRQRSLLAKVRRRGVLHICGLYIITDWVVIQVADTVVSEGAVRLIWIALILGFPVATLRQAVSRSTVCVGKRRDQPEAIRNGSGMVSAPRVGRKAARAPRVRQPSCRRTVLLVRERSKIRVRP